MYVACKSTDYVEATSLPCIDYGFAIKRWVIMRRHFFYILPHDFEDRCHSEHLIVGSLSSRSFAKVKVLQKCKNTALHKSVFVTSGDLKVAARNVLPFILRMVLWKYGSLLQHRDPRRNFQPAFEWNISCRRLLIKRGHERNLADLPGKSAHATVNLFSWSVLYSYRGFQNEG